VREKTESTCQPHLSQHVISLRHVTRQFNGKRKVVALEDINLEIARGEMVSLVGPSGSGKSTLLNLIGGPRQPHIRRNPHRRRRCRHPLR
jgi:ABC-type lipoprotein export system ATPase subunit